MTDFVVHSGMDAARAALDGPLAALVGPDRVDAWSVSRASYRPELWVATEAGQAIAAVMTTARPATAATTLVDPWFSSHGAGAELLSHLIGNARTRRDVAIKWSSRSDAPVFALDAGFVPLRRPLGAVGTEEVRGAVLWLEPIAHQEPDYYAQTTLYTCGAVAALMGAGLRGAAAFTAEPKDRDRELDFWRRASNFPACEPLGLAVATAEHLGTTAVDVAIDADGPTLLEGYTGFDLSFRTELQAESRRRATELGLSVSGNRVEVTEIARRVGAGELALLLIDEEPIHGEHGPHWVLAHASDGSDVVVVEDPWINRETGETWVDTHELPIRLADLDRLCRWSPAEYRGVIFVGDV